MNDYRGHLICLKKEKKYLESNYCQTDEKYIIDGWVKIEDERSTVLYPKELLFDYLF